MAALPRSASASGVPIASSRRSTSVSTRLMKKLATLATRLEVGAGGGGVLLEPGEVGVHHLLVPLEAEDECDVDVAALGDHLLDRLDAGRGGRDLHHQVAALDLLVEAARRCLGARRVVRQLGRHLDAGVAVETVA